MPAVKGVKTGVKPAGSGRRPGSKNKMTIKVKTAIYEAFELAGGVKYLQQVAIDDPKTFCTLLGKVLPSEIATVDDKPIVVTWQK